MSDRLERLREWQRQRKINGGPTVPQRPAPAPAPVDNRNWFRKLNARFNWLWKRVF